MSAIASSWPVNFPTVIDDADVDGQGALTEAAVLRIASEVLDAYVAACPRLREVTLEPRPRSAVMRAPIETPGTSSVTAAATEIFPASFDVDFRIHPPAGGKPAVEAIWAVAVTEGVSDDLRDELISLARAARHLS